MATPGLPPSYEVATGSNAPPPSSSDNKTQSPAHNGIPPSVRRSMEDEYRPLPPGWIRQYDPDQSHQFFVDVNQEPPRVIWAHPYDDAEFMSSLDPAERKRINELNRMYEQADAEPESMDEAEHHPQRTAGDQELPPREELPGYAGKPKGLGGKVRDKLAKTSLEHKARREQRHKEEEQAFILHEALRRAMKRSHESGQPEYVGRDPQSGKDIYVEPPPGRATSRSVGKDGHSYNPYSEGPYANPNAVFVKAPSGPYARGYDTGSGYRSLGPSAVTGGVLGGLLLGVLTLGVL